MKSTTARASEVPTVWTARSSRTTIVKIVATMCVAATSAVITAMAAVTMVVTEVTLTRSHVIVAKIMKFVR